MSIAKTSNELSPLEQAAKELEERRQAARDRKAAKLERDGAAENQTDTVTVRVTKFGDGLVSTGEHVGGEGDLCYDIGDEPVLPRAVAVALERKGLVEIQEPKAPKAPKEPAAA